MSDFLGLPPCLPFSLADCAFASEVTLPPRRPNATAAGFLAIVDAPFHDADDLIGVNRADCVKPLFGKRTVFGGKNHGLSMFSVNGPTFAVLRWALGALESVIHELNVTQALGFVKGKIKVFAEQTNGVR